MKIDRKYRKVLKKNTAYLKDYDQVIPNADEFLSKLIPIINSVNFNRPDSCVYSGNRNPALSYWEIYLNERFEIRIPSYKLKKPLEKLLNLRYEQFKLGLNSFLR